MVDLPANMNNPVRFMGTIILNVQICVMLFGLFMAFLAIAKVRGALASCPACVRLVPAAIANSDSCVIASCHCRVSTAFVILRPTRSPKCSEEYAHAFVVWQLALQNRHRSKL